MQEDYLSWSIGVLKGEYKYKEGWHGKTALNVIMDN